MHAPTASLADNLCMPPLAKPVAAVDATALVRLAGADANSRELSFIVGNESIISGPPVHREVGGLFTFAADPAVSSKSRRLWPSESSGRRLPSYIPDCGRCVDGTSVGADAVLSLAQTERKGIRHL
ncbi:hypothetical protein [Nocardia sp. NPDC047038]|uniref:hypothetical protein n=1 Tax=Nocardia sp. NPDC047038 TaxID=3154338 RepID=UPI0033DEEE6C